MDSILLIGCAGSVAHDMLYLMASMGKPMKVVGADFNEQKGLYEIEESLQIAHNLGFLGVFPEFSFRKIDLFNIEQTAELINDIKPKVICNLASLGSWWITRLLPDSEYKKIGPIGPWLPNHLTLTYKLMKAVKMTGLDIKVVNGAFPDATNVVLSKVGLAPHLRRREHGYRRPKDQTDHCQRQKCSHPERDYLRRGPSWHLLHRPVPNGPFWLKILVEGSDLTSEYPNEKITEMYREAGHAASVQFSGPLVDQMKTAVSFLNNVLGIYFDTKRVHEAVPAPEGLPGGYPARVSAAGVEVVLPGISREQAIEINKAGGRIDGIEEIKDDGTVVYLDQNVENMRQVVGYDCKELKLEESEERAKELESKLKKLYEKYKV